MHAVYRRDHWPVDSHTVRKDAVTLPAHRGASAVATVFLAVALLVLGLGLMADVWFGFYAHNHLNDSVGASIGLAFAGALGVVFLTCVLAFFGYVIDLLVEIAENTST